MVQATQAARNEVASGSGDNISALRTAADDEPVKEDGDDVQPPVKQSEEQKDHGGLPGVDCSVCLTRPVQVSVSLLNQPSSVLSSELGWLCML